MSSSRRVSSGPLTCPETQPLSFCCAKPVHIAGLGTIASLSPTLTHHPLRKINPANPAPANKFQPWPACHITVDCAHPNEAAEGRCRTIATWPGFPGCVPACSAALWSRNTIEPDSRISYAKATAIGHDHTREVIAFSMRQRRCGALGLLTRNTRRHIGRLGIAHLGRVSHRRSLSRRCLGQH